MAWSEMQALFARVGVPSKLLVPPTYLQAVYMRISNIVGRKVAQGELVVNEFQRLWVRTFWLSSILPDQDPVNALREVIRAPGIVVAAWKSMLTLEKAIMEAHEWMVFNSTDLLDDTRRRIIGELQIELQDRNVPSPVSGGATNESTAASRSACALDEFITLFTLLKSVTEPFTAISHVMASKSQVAKQTLMSIKKAIGKANRIANLRHDKPQYVSMIVAQQRLNSSGFLVDTAVADSACGQRQLAPATPPVQLLSFNHLPGDFRLNKTIAMLFMGGSDNLGGLTLLDPPTHPEGVLGSLVHALMAEAMRCRSIIYLGLNISPKLEGKYLTSTKVVEALFALLEGLVFATSSVADNVIYLKSDLLMLLAFGTHSMGELVVGRAVQAAVSEYLTNLRAVVMGDTNALWVPFAADGSECHTQLQEF